MISQEKNILKYLQAGNSITPLEALEMMGCLRLGARIFNLKRKGHDIKSRIIYIDKKHYAEYYI